MLWCAGRKRGNSVRGFGYLIDLPNNGGSAAFTIDMATVQEQESERIFAFVDMFPESSGLMNTNLIQPGSAIKGGRR